MMSFAVTGGTVRKAKRVDGRNDLREIHVAPVGWDDVAVTLAGGRACGTAGAICTAGGEVLSNTLSATIKGPVAIEVADARVRGSGGRGAGIRGVAQPYGRRAGERGLRDG